jgi:spore photoproduct lyase
MDWTERFKEVLIEEAALGTSLEKRVRSLFPGDAIRVTADGDRAEASCRESLIVAIRKGPFLRRCPGTPGMLCCNLHVLDLVVGCPFDCSYCFLHSYQENPGVLVHADFMDAAAEIADLVTRGGPGPLRVTTGELGDSLALESLTGMAAKLVPFFGSLPGAQLELKTKCSDVKALHDLEHGGRVVVSWSLSPDVVAREQESGAPAVDARLRAAEEAATAGYALAFHFDPVFLVDGWERHYVGLIDEVFDRVPPDAVLWFSLGGFRFTPALKEAVRGRFPETRIFLDEFLPCRDGKNRYFAPLRADMYRTLRLAIERRAPQTPVYACMESPHIWKEAFGSLPGECAKLDPIYRPFLTPPPREPPP